MVLVKIHHNFNVRLLLKLPLDLILKVTCFKKKISHLVFPNRVETCFQDFFD